MEWNVKDGCLEKAVKKFLNTQAPLPEGSEQIGRYHAPGSQNGWLIVKTEDISKIYIHASEWGELLRWNITPILEDKCAGGACAEVWLSN